MSRAVVSDGGAQRRSSQFGNVSVCAGVQNCELRYVTSSMRRRVIAAAWITGATIPLLAAALFLFGCCVLPFHGVIHRVMPACEIAAHLVCGGHDDHDHQSTPARHKQEPAKRIATELPAGVRFSDVSTEPLVFAPSASAALRSFVALGALRCDQDVGLHILVKTFLI
jgi:hypothetical protein